MGFRSPASRLGVLRRMSGEALDRATTDWPASEMLRAFRVYIQAECDMVDLLSGLSNLDTSGVLVGPV
jgi:hypothetical protein